MMTVKNHELSARTIVSTALFLLLPCIICLDSTCAQNIDVTRSGGCEHPAPVSIAVGSGTNPEKASKVLDSNLTSIWTAWGEGKSVWLELAAPTIVEAVSIAFRKAIAVAIVGYGNNKNKSNGFSEVQVCAYVPTETSRLGAPITQTNEPVVVRTIDTPPFPKGRKGFNIVNMCSFPIRVGSTGGQAACSEGTSRNPANGNCFWALPAGRRDIEPGAVEQYVLPELGLKDGSIMWSGNIWASTGCPSDVSDKYESPISEGCVTNFCPGSTCPDYYGPAGITTKAEFTLQQGGLDFYDVSVIDGANIPMMISPTEAVPTTNDQFCGSPGSTSIQGGLSGCSWGFAPREVDNHGGADLSFYTRVVWPNDPDHPTSCLDDGQCKALGEGVCGIYEERSNAGASKTGSIKPNVCGTPVGWLGAHSACGARREVGVSFPDAYPFDCHRAARHGIFEQLYRCSGDVYGTQACYLNEAQDSCCGCPEWDENNGGCVNTNPDWTDNAAQWAKFFKRACPTAYSFPRDDRTSMFMCSNEDLVTGLSPISKRNTQSYTITLCPGASEANMFT